MKGAPDSSCVWQSTGHQISSSLRQVRLHEGIDGIARRISGIMLTFRVGQRSSLSHTLVHATVCDLARGWCGGGGAGQTVKWKVVPGPLLAVAHSRPPWSSTIERLMESPFPLAGDWRLPMTFPQRKRTPFPAGAANGVGLSQFVGGRTLRASGAYAQVIPLEDKSCASLSSSSGLPAFGQWSGCWFLSAISRHEISCSSLQGLLRKSIAPASRARRRVRSSGKAVTKMIGTCRPWSSSRC